MHFHFSQNFLSSRKVAKKRKYLTFSKFTKSVNLVNLLVLETQGSKTTAERIGPYEKKRKQQVQKTSLRAGRLTLHMQRNHNNEAKEPGSLSQGSGKRIELSAFTCMDRWCWGHCRGAKHDCRYPRARAQGATFVGAPAGTIKHLLVPLRVPTLLTDMLRRPASIQQLLAWSTSGELPMTMGGG